VVSNDRPTSYFIKIRLAVLQLKHVHRRTDTIVAMHLEQRTVLSVSLVAIPWRGPSLTYALSLRIFGISSRGQPIMALRPDGEFGGVLATHCNATTKCHTGPRTGNDSFKRPKQREIYMKTVTWNIRYNENHRKRIRKMLDLVGVQKFRGHVSGTEPADDLFVFLCTYVRTAYTTQGQSSRYIVESQQLLRDQFLPNYTVQHPTRQPSLTTFILVSVRSAGVTV
jgi:hypothetical protein